MNTPRHFIGVVIYTLAVMSMLYMGTLAWCVVMAVPVAETLGALSHVGDTVIGAFTGMLISTRSSPGEPTTSETVITSTETKTP